MASFKFAKFILFSLVFTFTNIALAGDPNASGTSEKGQSCIMALSRFAVLLKEAQLKSKGELATQARTRLLEAMGPVESFYMFGADFNSWPLLLGVSKGGHMILATTRSYDDYVELNILSLKRLRMTTKDYIERRELDTRIAFNEASPIAGYESILSWLNRTEGSFNKVTAAFSQRENKWTTQDSNYSRLDRTVMTDSRSFGGVNGAYERPWMIRRTTVNTPLGDGTFRSSTPEEILPLVHDLLNAQ